MTAGSENSDLYQNVTKNSTGMLKEHVLLYQNLDQCSGKTLNMVPQLFLAQKRTAPCHKFNIFQTSQTAQCKPSMAQLQSYKHLVTCLNWDI